MSYAELLFGIRFPASLEMTTRGSEVRGQRSEVRGLPITPNLEPLTPKPPFQLSAISVTGPSLTRKTSIIARN
jgi:hypothetical protein